MADEDGKYKFVTTQTPQRLSFIGGGTDFPGFYTIYGGGVVSSTIDKYIYVTVKQLSKMFGEGYRLNYSKTEHVETLDQIENKIARECLRLVEVPAPLFIGTIADLPASSGLGSSSSFAVGLLYALHLMRGEVPSAGQLAEEACDVELNALKQPIGKQDQYAAAFGGLNYIDFDTSGRVRLDPLIVSKSIYDEITQHSLMFWTGVERDAGDILAGQKDNIPNRIDELCQLRDMTLECREMLLAETLDIVKFGALLDRNWRIKRELAENVTTDYIDQAYEVACKAGAFGGKIAGAGGGGFLYLLVPLNAQEQVRAVLSDLSEVKITLETRGSRRIHGNVL